MCAAMAGWIDTVRTACKLADVSLREGEYMQPRPDRHSEYGMQTGRYYCLGGDEMAGVMCGDAEGAEAGL